MKHDEQVPFFARFLESQEYPEVETDVKAGKPPGGGTSPTLDLNHTMKYPSDGDEV
jgi:hypothetical protein